MIDNKRKSGAPFTGSVLSRNVRRNKKIVAGDRRQTLAYFSVMKKRVM